MGRLHLMSMEYRPHLSAQAAANPSNTINDVKRLIGRHFSESEVQADLHPLTCTVANASSLSR